MSFRSLALACLLLLGLPFVLTGCRKTTAKNQEPPPANTLAYKSSSGFTMYYPNTWTQQQSTFRSVEFMAVHPLANSSDDFAGTYTSVASEPLATDTSPQAYCETKRAMMSKDMQGFTEVSNSAFSGNDDGWKMVYSYTLNGKKMQSIAHFFVHGKRGVVVTGSAKPDICAALEPLFDNIAKEIRWE